MHERELESDDDRRRGIEQRPGVLVILREQLRQKFLLVRLRTSCRPTIVAFYCVHQTHNIP